MSRFMYDDKLYTNPPIDIQSPLLVALYTRLNSYAGADEVPRQADQVQSLADRIIDDAPRPSHTAPYQLSMPDASVLVAITNEAEPKLLLTRRSGRLTHHAGEVSFVGGKRDDSDRHTAHTALREAYEEVALHPKHAHVIGYLPMHRSKAGLLVRPVVALIDPYTIPKLMPSEDETERLFWLPLATVLYTQPTDHQMSYAVGETTYTLTTPAWLVDIDHDGALEVVWGLTARILSMLAKIGYDVDYEWYYRISPSTQGSS